MVCDAEGLEHGLLPVAAAAFDSSDGVDDAKGQDTFNGPGDDA